MSTGKREMPKKRSGGKVFLRVLLILALLAGGAWCTWKYLLPEPETAVPAMGTTGDLTPADTAAGGAYERKPHCWTFLLVGMDKVGSNTDSLILVRYDVDEQTVSMASIARDTCVNTGTRGRKVNAAWANGGMDELKAEVSRTFCMPIDFFIKVNVNGFVALVDELGGVDFDVPCNMSYDDPYQGLSIHYQKGVQHLSGQQALEVCRFRKNNDGSGYTDTGRTETQRAMLAAIAKKLLSWGSLTRLSSFLDIAAENVETDLSASDIAWFAERATRFDTEKEGALNTMMFPATWQNPYMYLDPDATLEMINEYLNPFTTPRTADMLDIMTP